MKQLFPMKKFTLGVITGASSLLVAVPILAQVSSAQSTMSDPALSDRPVPSQACLTALVAKEDAVLADMETHAAERKAAALAHRDALAAAATITEGVERGEAFRTAQEAFHASMMAVDHDAMKATMDAVREACGEMFGFRAFHKGHHGMGGFGMMGRPGPEGWMHERQPHENDDEVEEDAEGSQSSTQQ